MRRYTSRTEDSTYELNLAPMLDIIVSIVPMLLLSVAFVQVAVVETPIPQPVQKVIEANKDKNDVQISLVVSKQTGFKISVSNKGQQSEKTVPLKGKDLDLAGLHKEVFSIKQQFPEVFRLEMHPDETVELSEIVSVMDQVRTIAKDEAKVFFTDIETGKKVETNLLFPDVVFGNVTGG